MAERSKALQLSCRGLAGCGFESRWGHIFIMNFFAPSPFRTGQRSRCKWNQACPFTWSHSCFRPQIWFIIQGLVYKYLQYSFKYSFACTYMCHHKYDWNTLNVTLNNLSIPLHRSVQDYSNSSLKGTCLNETTPIAFKRCSCILKSICFISPLINNIVVSDCDCYRVE